jgi:hypothetical protein
VNVPRFASLIGAALVLAGVADAQPLEVEKLDIATARGVYHFKVEVADNDGARERGLMFRRGLAADHGMLFDFKTAQPVSFWMKNTLIPLDMLFITTNGRILTIAHAVPLSETPVPSGGPVLGVLEIAGGRAAAIGAVPGDKVRERIFRK